MTVSTITNGSPMQANATPGGIMPGGNVMPVTTGGSNSAEDLYSAMSQQQWLQYVNQFMPIENQAIAYATNQDMPQQNMQRAIQGVQDQESTQAVAQKQRLAQYGVTLSPQEAAAANRDTSISNSLAEVDAANRARDTTLDQQRAILGAPVATGAPMHSSSSMTAVG